MKPSWKYIADPRQDSHNCKCLTCGKEFTFLGDGHFNMKLIKCPTCNQEVWVPKCPNGCKSFIEENLDEEALYAKHDSSLSRLKHFMRSHTNSESQRGK